MRSLGMNSFRMFVVDPFVETIGGSIIDALRSARTSGTVENAERLNVVVKIFVELGLGALFFYEQNIESPYLTDLRAYIRAQRSRMEGDDAQKNEQVRMILNKEWEHASQVLHASTQAKITEVAPK